MTQEEKEKIIKEYIEKQQLTAVKDMELETRVSLIEEAGEVIGVFKKFQFHKHRNKEELKEKLAEEIGDLVWYLTQFAKENNLLKELEKNLCIRLDYNSTINEFDSTTLHNYCYALMGDILKMSKLDKNDRDYAKSFDSYLSFIFYTIFTINNQFNGYKSEEILYKNIKKLEKRYKNRIK